MSSLLNRPIDYKSKLDAADNVAAVVTYAALAGNQHHVFYVAWSYNAAPTGGKLTIDDDTTAVFELDITAAGPKQIALPPIIGTVGKKVVITLAAAGAAVAGKVNVGAFTE